MNCGGSFRSVVLLTCSARFSNCSRSLRKCLTSAGRGCELNETNGYIGHIRLDWIMFLLHSCYLQGIMGCLPAFIDVVFTGWFHFVLTVVWVSGLYSTNKL